MGRAAIDRIARSARRRLRAQPVIAAAAIVTATLLVAVPPLRAAPAPADRELFVRYGCYQCHGYEGQGGEALRIAPSPYSFEAFAAKVRKPANEMPAYAPEVLSDLDLRISRRGERTLGVELWLVARSPARSSPCRPEHLQQHFVSSNEVVVERRKHMGCREADQRVCRKLVSFL